MAQKDLQIEEKVIFTPADKSQGIQHKIEFILNANNSAFIDELYGLGYKKYDIIEKNGKQFAHFEFTQSKPILAVLKFLQTQCSEVYNKLQIADFHQAMKAHYHGNLQQKRQLAKLHKIEPAEGFDVDYDVDDSINEVGIVEIDGKSYFYKEDSALVDSRINEQQVAVANLNLLMSGLDRGPRSNYVVYNEKNQRLGVLHEAIEDFQDLQDYLEDMDLELNGFADASLGKDDNYNIEYDDEMIDALIQGNIFKPLAFALLTQDIDGTASNIFVSGSQEEGTLAFGRIDFGWALAPQKIQHFQEDAELLEKVTENRGCPLTTGFEITANDLGDDFTKPKQFNLYRWLDKNLFGNGETCDEYSTPDLAEKIAAHKDYNKQKFSAFLKIILMLPKDIQLCIKNAEPVAKHQKVLFDIITSRQLNIKSELLKLSAFNDFLKKHGPKVIKSILTEMIAYYQSQPMEETWSIEAIHENIEGICQRYNEFAQVPMCDTELNAILLAGTGQEYVLGHAANSETSVAAKGLSPLSPLNKLTNSNSNTIFKVKKSMTEDSQENESPNPSLARPSSPQYH